MQFAENGGTFVQKAQILSIQSTRDGWFPRRKTVRLLGVTASLPVRADGCPVDADAAWPRPRRAGASWMRAAWATPRQVGPPSRGSRKAAREPQARGWARNCPCCSSRGGRRGASPGRAWTPEPCARSCAGHLGLGGPRARPREGRSVMRDRGTPDACGGPPRSCEPKPRGPSAVAMQGRMRVAEAPGRQSPIRGRAGRSGR